MFCMDMANTYQTYVNESVRDSYSEVRGGHAQLVIDVGKHR